MLYFVTGASGSGKSAILTNLKELHPEAIIHDFDEVRVPPNADKVWRQKTTEEWIRKYLNRPFTDKPFVLCGGTIVGEILACPSAQSLGTFNILLLDVTDKERVHRLKMRGSSDANQDMLNWSSWIRMHFHSPQWHPEVIVENSWNAMLFERWSEIESWNKMAEISTADTTHMSVSKVAQKVYQWIQKVTSNG